MVPLSWRSGVSPCKDLKQCLAHSECCIKVGIHVVRSSRLCSELLQSGTSLVVQWLRIRLPMQATRVRALAREDPTCRGATKPVSHNY